MEKAATYEQNGLNKKEIDNAIDCLQVFRAKFPFAENPASIATLKPDDIFKETSDEAGEFFHYLDHYLKPLGHIPIRGSSVYNIRVQIEDFKNLLKVTVDKKKSLAQKVDASWEKIRGLGENKLVAKKIIFCFNYESGKVLPIFSTNHLKHFISKVAGNPSLPAKYYTLGEEYECLTSELLKAKNNLPATHTWEITYFARFLYENYPPPDREKAASDMFGERKTGNVVTREQLELGEFMHLLGELQRQRKITGQQFRENRELWVNQPQERNSLTNRLKVQLN
jgi:hypothetical protein